VPDKNFEQNFFMDADLILVEHTHTMFMFELPAV
jgi:hypothetical protein